MTFSSIAKVSHDHALAIEASTVLEAGEYPVLVVIQENSSAPRPALSFSNHYFGATREAFRREDLYTDDGR